MRNRLLVFLLIILTVIPLTAVYGEEKPKIHNVVSEAQATFSTVNIPDENPVFKRVAVSGEKGFYRVEGQVKPKNGTFYYAVEDGHHQQIQETKEVVSGEGWKSFVLELKIPDDQLPQNGTLILNLYERRNGTVVNSYSIVLEKFY